MKNRKFFFDAYNDSKHLKNTFSYLLDIIEYDFDHYLQGNRAVNHVVKNEFAWKSACYISLEPSWLTDAEHIKKPQYFDHSVTSKVVISGQKYQNRPNRPDCYIFVLQSIIITKWITLFISTWFDHDLECGNVVNYVGYLAVKIEFAWE